MLIRDELQSQHLSITQLVKKRANSRTTIPEFVIECAIVKADKILTWSLFYKSSMGLNGKYRQTSSFIKKISLIKKLFYTFQENVIAAEDAGGIHLEGVYFKISNHVKKGNSFFAGL